MQKAPNNPFAADGLYYWPEDLCLIPHEDGIAIAVSFRKGLQVCYRFMTPAGPVEVVTADVISYPPGTKVRSIWRPSGRTIP